MNSINNNQFEKNHEDLEAQDAIDKIKEIVDKAESCFFTTSSAIAGSSGARPMAVREFDDNGIFWFLSAIDSHKNTEVDVNPLVTLYFQGSPHSDFLQINGHAEILTDKQKIKELWGPLLRSWFTEGIDDPRISVIKVTPTDGYYWDTKHGNAVAGLKMIVGATIGKTMDDSIEGRLHI